MALAQDTTVAALLRRWHWVVLGAALLGLGAASWAELQPPIYVASTTVVPVRAMPPVVVGAVVTYATVPPERRQTLAQLVGMPDVERAVQEELGQLIPPQLRSRGALLTLVSGSTSLRSELITIAVEARDPDFAVSVAAAWAREYVRRVNDVYGAEEVRVVNNVVLATSKGKGTRVWAARGAVSGALGGALAGLVAPTSIFMLGTWARHLHRDSRSALPREPD